jgi:hypothetical protein
MRDLFLVGQLAVFVLAMAGGYVVELPYLKLQLLLVCFLAVSSAVPSGGGAAALDFLRRSLALYPFHPVAFRLCADMFRRAAPEKARRCEEIHDYVLDQASDGFRRSYPLFLER